MEIYRLWDWAKVRVLELGGGVCGHGDGFKLRLRLSLRSPASEVTRSDPANKKYGETRNKSAVGVFDLFNAFTLDRI